MRTTKRADEVSVGDTIKVPLNPLPGAATADRKVAGVFTAGGWTRFDLEPGPGTMNGWTPRSSRIVDLAPTLTLAKDPS